MTKEEYLEAVGNKRKFILHLNDGGLIEIDLNIFTCKIHEWYIEFNKSLQYSFTPYYHSIFCVQVVE